MFSGLSALELPQPPPPPPPRASDNSVEITSHPLPRLIRQFLSAHAFMASSPKGWWVGGVEVGDDGQGF